MFKNDIHKKIFEKQLTIYEKKGYGLSNKFVATLFIISANSFLWNACKGHIKPNTIDFSNIDIKGIKTDSYSLLKAAKSIYYKDSEISFTEMADNYLTKDYVFKTIINGIIIYRYGYKKGQIIIKTKEHNYDNE